MQAKNFLIIQVSSFKQGDATVTALPVTNSVSRAAFFWEGGVQARLLNVALSQAHSDKQSFLLPAFQIATGFRQILVSDKPATWQHTTIQRLDGSFDSLSA
jgi:hypothetical protein